MVFDASSPIGARGAQLVVVDRGMQADLGDARRELEQHSLHAALSARWADDDAVGEHGTFFCGESTEWEARDPLTLAVAQTHREAEFHRQLEVDVEEVGALFERAEVTGDMAHIEAPHDGALDLGAGLSPDLVEVGVVPRIFDRARESTVAVEEAGGVGDRPPPVRIEFGVERELHTDVLAPIARRCISSPWARHHQ